MINAGSTTPTVAHKAPKIPPCELPTKVAIFTAIGPGVDSAMPIKLDNISSESHPCEETSSFKRAIIPAPPPKENRPIFKKERKS
jgi:hypothetical protein